MHVSFSPVCKNYCAEDHARAIVYAQPRVDLAHRTDFSRPWLKEAVNSFGAWSGARASLALAIMPLFDPACLEVDAPGAIAILPCHFFGRFVVAWTVLPMKQRILVA